jgi:hypothetical protein
VNDIVFNRFGPDNLPPYHKPILIQFKADCYSAISEASPNSLLRPAHFYGYVVCLLDFTLDGFGNRVPVSFKPYRMAGSYAELKGEPAVAFSSVALWAELPS